LPITSFCLVLPWGYTVIIRYVKVNAYLKTACCFAVSGLIFYFVDFINMVLGLPYSFGIKFNFNDWSIEYLNNNINAIIIFALLGLTVIFSILGIVREVVKFKTYAHEGEE